MSEGRKGIFFSFQEHTYSLAYMYEYILKLGNSMLVCVSESGKFASNIFVRHYVAKMRIFPFRHFLFSKNQYKNSKRKVTRNEDFFA